MFDLISSETWETVGICVGIAVAIAAADWLHRDGESPDAE